MTGSEIEIGGFKRAERNQWGVSLEPMIRDLAPFPISYDVDSTQPAGFTEYSYTEFLGGLYLNTQSVEINSRIIHEASTIACKTNHVDKLAKIHDKYELNAVISEEWPSKVAFMVGHNMFDLVSPEVVARTAFENEDFYVKLHPLTNDDYAGKVANLVGWNRIIAGNHSGVDLLAHCDEAYVTTASELCALAVAMGKRIRNISSFFHESSGIYYPINRLLFRSQSPQQVLANILDCEFSGIIHPWTKDPEQKIRNYFKRTLEVRELFKPVASPSKLKKN